ncbi:hypothetical protein GSI_11773 [Ganoderma sinense ZZ0214-1]|uniref:MARVEL domain-containing protein n=1 Tax=Ganoderma sinense ZZ0214-1 TaxID=1077348 RepID=A0A2G8RWX3_9APHY|nr:hypothetical protein GSI_11773 [Ganoderma sinense ZZ0214-1]
MGGVVYLCRLGSLTLSTVTAVIVLGLCISTLKTYHRGVEDGDPSFSQSLNYANIGIASGAMAIITLPMMLLVDFIKDGKLGLPIIIEVPWLLVLWVMFLATEISTKNFGHNFNPDGVSCDEIPDIIGSPAEEIVDVCKKWEPIEITSWITAGLVFFYSVTLIGVTIKKGNSGSSMWNTSVKNSKI